MLHPIFSPPNIFVREFSDEVHWAGKTHHNVSGTILWAGALNSMKRKPDVGRWHSSISDPLLEGSVPCYCILRWLFPLCLPWWAVPSNAKQMQNKHINISEHMKNKTQGPKRENQLCLLNVLSLKKSLSTIAFIICVSFQIEPSPYTGTTVC